MFSRVAFTMRPAGARLFSNTSSLPKVAVIGAAGGIGQPLALLLKNSQHVGDLNLYDLVNTPGVAADLSHINSPGKVSGFTGPDELADCLKGCKAVVVPAGVPRKPGMTRDDLFNTNASIVRGIAQAVAQHCPDAFLCIISNPVNSTVPICAETLKEAGVYDPRKLFGVTSLDVTRANTFCAEVLDKDVNDMNVTVCGGHAGTTICPILSGVDSSLAEDAELQKRIQFGGDEVVQAKAGAGSATLSMAYAGAVFTERLLQAAGGEQGVVECAFVESSAVPECEYFSTPISLGPNGVEEIHPVPAMSAMEKANFDAMIPDLVGQIAKGKQFAADN